MITTRTRFSTAFVTTLFTCLPLLVTPSKGMADEDPIKVDAFLDLSGPESYAAKALQQGMELALSDPSSSKLQVRFLDLKSAEPIGTGDEANLPPFLIHWSEESIAAASPQLNQSKIVGLIAWGVNKKVARLGSYTFGFGYSVESSIKAFAKFAGMSLKSNRIGLISSSDERFDRQGKVFSEESKSLGNTIVFDEKISNAQGDFGSLIARAQKEKCDTLFAALPTGSAVAFVKAVRQQGYKGRVLLGDSLFAPEVTALGKDAEGIFMVQSWSSDESFASRYAAKFGSRADGVLLGAAAMGSDLITCITALKKEGDSHGEKFSSDTFKYSLLATPCEGLTGKTGFSGERMAQRRKRIVTVKNGEFSLAE